MNKITSIYFTTDASTVQGAQGSRGMFVASRVCDRIGMVGVGTARLLQADMSVLRRDHYDCEVPTKRK
jgi:hypothetical protein